jgi:hypothetical protein
MVPRLLYTACPGEVIDIDTLDDGPLPAPCCRCGKPASPFVDTAHGLLCFACADPDGPDAPTDPGARAAWRDVALTRTHRRLVAARAARELAPVLVPAPALATIGQ